MVYKRSRVSGGRKRRYTKLRKLRKRSKKNYKKRYSKKRSLAVKIARIMNAPQTYSVESFMQVGFPSLRRTYIDLAARSDPANNVGSPVAVIMDAFGNPDSYLDIAAKVFNTSGTNLDPKDTLWALKETKYYELTNVTNVPIYCRLHKIYPKHDMLSANILDEIAAIIANYVTQGGVYQNFNANVFYDDPAAFSAIVAPYIYAGPPERLDATSAKYLMNNFDVLSSVFKDPLLMTEIRKHFKVVSSKEFVLGPQQQLPFKMKRKKPFLIDWTDHVLPLVAGSGTTRATGQYYKCWKGFTCTAVLEVVGMTGSDLTDQNTSLMKLGMPSTAGDIAIACRKSVSLAQRVSKNKHYVRDSASYLSVVIPDDNQVGASVVTSYGGPGGAGTGIVTKTEKGAAFGAANNNAVGVAK